jgi:restriction endonuclease S subunit
MYNFPLPIPSLVAQQEIIANIEAERKIIDSCQELMVKYWERIKNGKL